MNQDTEKEFLSAYDAYADALYKHCFFRVYSATRAEELVQDTFMKTWDYLVKGKQVDNFRAFLYKTANNLIIDYSRKKRELSLEQELAENPGWEPSLDQPTLEHNLLLQQVRESLLQLPEEARQLLTWRYIDDLDPRDIAEIFEPYAEQCLSEIKSSPPVVESNLSGTKTMNPLDNLKKLKDAQLFPADRKQALRKNLLVHMSLHSAEQVNGASFWLWLNEKLFSRPMAVVLASLILVILVGTGTAVAASNALPGQALYSIKTHVNEPVRAALTVRADDRAIYETELATKRMEEAQALAAAGELDEATQTELSQDFNDHVAEVHARVQNFQTEHFNEVQALLDQAKSKLNAGDYEGAAELGRRASAAAHNLSNIPGKDLPAAAPSVKGESTSAPNTRSNNQPKDK